MFVRPETGIFKKDLGPSFLVKLGRRHPLAVLVVKAAFSPFNKVSLGLGRKLCLRKSVRKRGANAKVGNMSFGPGQKIKGGNRSKLPAGLSLKKAQFRQGAKDNRNTVFARF